MRYVLIGFLKAYRLVISPLYGDVCRYYPSCSAYALRAVEVHGAVKGTWLAGRRLLRCHPWASGGYDPVPGTPEFAEEVRDQAVRAATMAAVPPGHSSAPGRCTHHGHASVPRVMDAEKASQRGVN
ncbi:membrane protein insertion efficiency factor YidD [uncultured Friedmanniella sp.]|uniref:membrane protein insertion efficiency factor YidD n=1 Tax=uncultured Friedmanniella sp. TaxID=335381 RepID=UPI0035C96179